MHATAEKFLRAIKSKIHRREFHGHGAERKIDRVLFRHAVKAPGEILLFRSGSQRVLHPFSAPDAGVKIGLQTEGSAGDRFQSRAKCVAADHFKIVIVVGVYHEVSALKILLLVPVRQSPLDEISDFVFCQNRIISIRAVPVADSSAVPELDLPSGKIAKDMDIRLREQLGSETDQHYQSLGFPDPFPKRPDLVLIVEGFHFLMTNNAEDPVVCDEVFKFLHSLLFGLGCAFDIDDL